MAVHVAETKLSGTQERYSSVACESGRKHFHCAQQQFVTGVVGFMQGTR